MQPEPGLADAFDALDDGSPFDLESARRGLDDMLALVQVTVPVASVEDGIRGGVPVRTYRDDGASDLVLVWLHGGGWITGSLDAVDGLCRDLAVRTRATVVSVDYRLAPEHPYPAALEDTIAVLEDVAATATGPVAVGGDSAGGNLVAVACARLRGRVPIAAQVLLSPAVDATLSSPSVAELAEGYGLTRTNLELFVQLYAGDADRTDPGLSPLLEPDLSGLPPTVVVTAGFDPLRDEAEAYADRLRDAGVPVRTRRWEGMVHGFHGMATHTPRAEEAVAWASEQLLGLLRD